MINAEQIVIDYHRARGDSRVTLRSEVIVPEGRLCLVRFYNPNGSCYSSLDKIDETGMVSEIARCHRLDERKTLDPIIRRKLYEADC